MAENSKVKGIPLTRDDGNMPSKGYRRGLLDWKTHRTKGAVVLAPKSLRSILRLMMDSA